MSDTFFTQDLSVTRNKNRRNKKVTACFILAALITTLAVWYANSWVNAPQFELPFIFELTLAAFWFAFIDAIHNTDDDFNRIYSCVYKLIAIANEQNPESDVVK